MVIGGLQKLTLIDYPGKVAATVFTVGCNFRCPFCHNPELVFAGKNLGQGPISEEVFFSFLDQRKGKLDGVCITGGEPTIQLDILAFIRRIKDKGFFVKLDSNGTRPDVLKRALSEEIVDFIAMDIKNSLERYSFACGTDVDVDRIKLSVNLVRNSGVGYEFRTTVVPGIHTYDDFKKIGTWLKGSKRYVIQEYQDKGKILDEQLKKSQKNVTIDLKRIKNMMKPYFDSVDIR